MGYAKSVSLSHVPHFNIALDITLESRKLPDTNKYHKTKGKDYEKQSEHSIAPFWIV